MIVVGAQLRKSLRCKVTKQTKKALAAWQQQLDSVLSGQSSKLLNFILPLLMLMSIVDNAQLCRLYTIAMDKAPRAFFFFLLQYSNNWKSSAYNAIIPLLGTSWKYGRRTSVIVPNITHYSLNLYERSIIAINKIAYEGSRAFKNKIKRMFVRKQDYLDLLADANIKYTQFVRRRMRRQVYKIRSYLRDSVLNNRHIRMRRVYKRCVAPLARMQQRLRKVASKPMDTRMRRSNIMFKRFARTLAQGNRKAILLCSFLYRLCSIGGRCALHTKCSGFVRIRYKHKKVYFQEVRQRTTQRKTKVLAQVLTRKSVQRMQRIMQNKHAEYRFCRSVIRVIRMLGTNVKVEQPSAYLLHIGRLHSSSSRRVRSKTKAFSSTLGVPFVLYNIRRNYALRRRELLAGAYNLEASLHRLLRARKLLCRSMLRRKLLNNLFSRTAALTKHVRRFRSVASNKCKVQTMYWRRSVKLKKRTFLLRKSIQYFSRTRRRYQCKWYQV